MRTVLLLAVIAASSIVVGTGVFIIPAGGHGWNAAAVSASALLLGPLGVLPVLQRETTTRRRLASAVCAVNFIVDSVFVLLSVREGTEYIIRAWRHLAPFIVPWAFLWLALQIVPLCVAVRSRAEPQRP